jgi:hypothetical protein
MQTQKYDITMNYQIFNKIIGVYLFFVFECLPVLLQPKSSHNYKKIQIHRQEDSKLPFKNTLLKFIISKINPYSSVNY